MRRSGLRKELKYGAPVALWDARTRESLKVFNTNGPIENRTDLSIRAMKDENKMKIVTRRRKRKALLVSISNHGSS